MQLDRGDEACWILEEAWSLEAAWPGPSVRRSILLHTVVGRHFEAERLHGTVLFVDRHSQAWAAYRPAAGLIDLGCLAGFYRTEVRWPSDVFQSLHDSAYEHVNYHSVHSGIGHPPHHRVHVDLQPAPAHGLAVV